MPGAYSRRPATGPVTPLSRPACVSRPCPEDVHPRAKRERRTRRVGRARTRPHLGPDGHTSCRSRLMGTRRKRRRERRQRPTLTAPPRAAADAAPLREAAEVERLAYNRRQAAEALGVSLSTIDRRVVPALDTVKTPWGQRLIPVAELNRFLWEHLEMGRPRPAPRPAGRPSVLSAHVVDRVRRG